MGLRADIEVVGCLNIKASYVSSANALTADTATTTNYADFFQSGADTLEASYVDGNAPNNPNGNYNEEARVPSGKCVFAPVTIAAATGGTIDVAGSTTLSFDALEAAIGTTQTAASARGAAKISVPANALTASASIEVGGLDTEAAASIPPPASDETVDNDLVFELSPCGQSFEEAVEICIFVGDEVPGSYFVLYHASDVSCSNSALGFQGWQPTTENTYNPTTGKLCGKITSFSIVAGVQKTTPTADFLPDRNFAMGGGCANDCSGHGYCRSFSKCFCFGGWAGFDCSQRECPFGYAWGVDNAVLRPPVECADRGVCNRDTGECECFDGFEGAACDRQTCPNDCSGHGKCRYISELPDVPSTYSEWDANRIQACVCDGGYYGSDCSLRFCPRGDDPQTICDGSTTRMTQEVTLSFVDTNVGNLESGSDELSLVFTDLAGQRYHTGRIESLWTNADSTTGDQDALIADIKEAFTSLPNFLVDDIDVSLPTTFDSTTETELTITFTFSGSQTTGNIPLLECPAELGCPFPGCRPLYNQMRLATATGGAPVSISTPNAVIPPAGYQGLRIEVDIEQDANYGAYFFTVTATPLTDSLTAGTPVVVISEQRVPSKDFSTDTVALGYGLQMTFSSATPAVNVPGSPYTFEYHVASCSTAITSRAGDNYEAHECAGRGLCNRDSGLCECFDGYSGHNCAQQVIVV